MKFDQDLFYPRLIQLILAYIARKNGLLVSGDQFKSGRNEVMCAEISPLSGIFLLIKTKSAEIFDTREMRREPFCDRSKNLREAIAFVTGYFISTTNGGNILFHVTGSPIYLRQASLILQPSQRITRRSWDLDTAQLSSVENFRGRLQKGFDLFWEQRLEIDHLSLDSWAHLNFLS